MYIHFCHRTGAGARHRPDKRELAEPSKSLEAADNDDTVRPPALSKTESPAVLTFLASVSVLLTNGSICEWGPQGSLCTDPHLDSDSNVATN